MRGGGCGTKVGMFRIRKLHGVPASHYCHARGRQNAERSLSLRSRLCVSAVIEIHEKDVGVAASLGEIDRTGADMTTLTLLLRTLLLPLTLAAAQGARGFAGRWEL